MSFTKTPDHRQENEDERCNCSVPEYGNGYCLIVYQYFLIDLIVSSCDIISAIIGLAGCGPQTRCKEVEEVVEGDQKTSKQSG